VRESERSAVEALPVLGEPSASPEPGEGAFDDPASGQHEEAFGPVRALDDLDVHGVDDALQAGLKLRPLIASIGMELGEEGEHAEQRRHDEHAAVAVLDVGGVDERVHQEALGVDEDVTLLALDLLACIEPCGSGRGPLFPRS
jgi:hypothetical protein